MSVKRKGGQGVAQRIAQRVANRGGERGLTRDDAFTTYVMDRLLFRLGRSAHAKDFFLKGGVLVANLINAPHRFTRDVDLLRRTGPPSPDQLREIFRQVIAVKSEDGIAFDPGDVRAVRADHDGYDGVKVKVGAVVGKHSVEVRIDIGLGDAVVPPAARQNLVPFLDGDEPARVLAYPCESVIAEKVQTLLAKFPAVLYRLKDLLDVVALSEALAFEGPTLHASLKATFERRRTRLDLQVLDELADIVGDKKWKKSWATMLKDKAVVEKLELREAVRRFTRFVQPVLAALADDVQPPARWEPGGPWEEGPSDD